MNDTLASLLPFVFVAAFFAFIFWPKKKRERVGENVPPRPLPEEFPSIPQNDPENPVVPNEAIIPDDKQ